MMKTFDGVIHGRTIELTDDPGMSDGERVVVEVRSKAGNDRAETRSRTKGVSAMEVLGLCNPHGATPPDDAECQRILEEELLRKYGQPSV